MSKVSFFLFLLLFALVHADTPATSSFYSYSPKTKKINGTTFPRNGLTLYRGTGDPQFSTAKAIKALLGDKNAYLESFFFTTIKMALQKKTFNGPVTLSSYLNKQIDLLIKKNKDQALSETQAVQETKALVDESFRYWNSVNKVVPVYIDYQSSQWQDWPLEVVFSTIVSPAAATYGDKLVVINESTPRSLDLNYWNYIHNGLWYVHTRDADEFIAPGYLPPNDITGYQVRTGKDKGWHFIKYALYKMKINGKPYILIFSGQKKNQQASTCMSYSSYLQKYVHCDYKAFDIALTPPQLTNEVVQLVGLLSLCPQKGSCQKVDQLKQHLKYPIYDDPQVLETLQPILKELSEHHFYVKLHDYKDLKN